MREKSAPLNKINKKGKYFWREGGERENNRTGKKETRERH